MTILLLNKDKGETSFSSIEQAQKILNFKKAGHAGTLDPLATGLLPIFFNQSTKFIQYFNTESKEYIADFIIGLSSNTEDITGYLSYELNSSEPTQDELKKAIDEFYGKSLQIPPIYSAKKIKGKPMHRLARKGIDFERAPHEIEIFNIELLEYEFPRFRIKVFCSKGTYIRTLGVDIGKKINQSVCMSGLVRTKFGHLDLDQTITLSNLKNLDKDKKMQYVRRIEEILIDIPKVEIRSSEVKNFQNGCQVMAREIKKTGKHFIFNNEDLLGMGEVDKNLNIQPIKVLVKGEN